MQTLCQILTDLDRKETPLYELDPLTMTPCLECAWHAQKKKRDALYRRTVPTFLQQNGNTKQ